MISLYTNSNPPKASRYKSWVAWRGAERWNSTGGWKIKVKWQGEISSGTP